jgi:hypothetical protein
MRRADRQRTILKGWRDAIWSGRYTAVRYDCASPPPMAPLTPSGLCVPDEHQGLGLPAPPSRDCWS